MFRKPGRMGIARLALLAIGVSIVAAGAAQDAQPGSGPRARAVRLSYVDGQVRLLQGDQVLADQAVVNTPLFAGMQLATGDSGKAEIQFEDGSVARLAPDSALTIHVLRGSGSSGDAELTLDSGLAYFEIQGGNQIGHLGILFGPAAATTSGFTAIRADMDQPPGGLAVFSGNVHLEIAAGTNTAPVETDIHGGESIALDASDPNLYVLSESIEPDSWDAWNSDRDEALTAVAAAQTATPPEVGSPDNPAWSDLDANGSWYDVPNQGYVWSPYDAANPGFDPYGNGDWAFTPGFGYVWASGYSWGYMPFQCGAWNFYGGFGWGWAPGMGGCSPWWGQGFYGGPNIGNMPPGYQPVNRPLPPRAPIGHHPIPLVPVNRHTTSVPTRLPTRDRSTPVTIAGNTVHPIAPLPSRRVFTEEVPARTGSRNAYRGMESLGRAQSSNSSPGDGSHALPGTTSSRARYLNQYSSQQSRGNSSSSYAQSRSGSGSSSLGRSFGTGASRSVGSSSGGYHGGSLGGGSSHGGSSGGGSHGGGGGGGGGGHGGGGGSGGGHR